MSYHWPSLTKDGKIEAVRRVWTLGLSARQIAAHFDGASRNAIIGLYGREAVALADVPLGGGARKAQANAARARAGQPKSKRAKQPRKRGINPFGPRPAVTPKPFFMTATGEGRRVPLLELRAGECRWPVNNAQGDELHLFCGEPADGSYCGHHAKRSVQNRLNV